MMSTNAGFDQPPDSFCQPCVVTAAGFKLDRSSEINSNPLDTKDHPGGVWNLLPNLRGVAENDKPKYRAMGESDRMTLRFTKP